jgi:antitoxin CcdA
MSTIAKRRTNVTLSGSLLEEARAFEINVSAVAETALAKAVAEARARAWADENARALAQRAAWIEANGLPLAPFQLWKAE